MSEMKQEDYYNPVISLLKRIITNESKYVESQRQTLKEDEFMILRLQNKARILDIEIEKREKSIEEYSDYLNDISEAAFIKIKPIPSKWLARNTELSITKFKLIANLENQEA